tara:strand:+ start:1422 stop:2096 length:675 start_codon:yes stop_codon:yes gene_type:complete
MQNNDIARLGLIIIAAVVFIYLIYTYNNGDNGNNGNQVLVENSQENSNISGNEIEGFYADGEQTENAPNVNESENVAENLSENESEEEPLPSEGEGNENETFKTVEQQENDQEELVNNANNNQNNNRLPNECYPKDTLTPQDLLPQDSNSTWAQTVPAGQGSLGDQNFLNAGFHVGINTVGQSLRNANLQLRSEPPNPQVKVSPWLQTTIDPDVNRKAFEIGEA